MLSAATTSRRALLLARTVRPATVAPVSARASSAAAAAAAPLQPEFKLKYIVERTASGELPVYSDFKNGGNARTIVRKVKGNVLALRQDLSDYLADGHIDPITKPPKVIIKPTSQQIEVSGRWVAEVKGWLEMRGF